MNNIAFVFSNDPYKNSNIKEGLDILLATISITDDIGVFFISDGVFILLNKQKPAKILLKKFIYAFNILKIYKINSLYACYNSAIIRGLDIKEKLFLKVQWLSTKDWYKCLNKFKIILNF